MTDNDDLRERVARALAEADGITICSDASYRHSSYGIRADAALSATPIEALQQRVERLESVEAAAIHMRERMIAARNFLAIGSTDDADRHLREGIEYFDIDPDCRAALGERADV